MIKIFEKENSSWDSKVNFCDHNDVFVGYDMGQDCCEHADWFIAEGISGYSYDNKYTHKHPDLDDYEFDKNFFQEVASEDLDAGEMVVFKMIAENKPDLFLHLFNSHNGYYGHGFEVKHGGITVKEGVL